MPPKNNTPKAKAAKSPALETLVLNTGDLYAFHVSADNPNKMTDIKKVGKSALNSAFCAFITTPIENKSGYANVEIIRKTCAKGNPKDSFDVYYLEKGKSNALENGTLVTSMTREDMVKRLDFGKAISQIMGDSAKLSPMMVRLVRDIAGKESAKVKRTFTI